VRLPKWRWVTGAAVATGAAAVVALRRGNHLHLRTSRRQRNTDVVKLGATVGAHYAGTAARKLFASTERRIELDRERELRTAEAVAERLGHMKGALMKLGQMASFIDEGLPGPLREALAQLQSNAPPMSGDLAAGVIEADLGKPPSELFVEWDPQPIAAASIGQVHRAVVFDPATGAERAVAVKVQYPGVGDAIEADLRNADLLGMVLKQGFGQTETSILCCLDAQDAVRKAGSVGRPVLHAELRIVRSETLALAPSAWRDCAPGETGEIVVRGPITMLGPVFRVDGLDPPETRPAPSLGADTESILKELGA